MRRLIAIFGVLILAVVVALAIWEPLVSTAAAPPAAQRYDVRIVRDDYGVPHVFGTRDADVAYGVAYAHAEDDFSTLQEVIAMTRARLGAITGQDGAKIDFVAHLLDIRGTVDRRYDALPGDVRALVDGYAAGLNHYAEKHPEEIRLKRLFPVNGRDVAAGFALRSPFFFGLDTVLGALAEDKPLPVEGGPLLQSGPPTPVGSDPEQNGSNGFAVAPSRSDDGATRLVSNSHQPWRGGVAWYELVVHSKQGWDFAGATFPGSPFPFLGHNKALGWTNTVNRPDLIDVYKLTLSDDGQSYRYDGKWLPLESKRVWLHVRFGPLTIPYPQTVHRSVHGPVVVNQSGAYSIRYAAIDSLDLLTQYYRINKARDFAEWKAAMALRGVPSTNFVYADAAGNIALVYNAMFPDRRPGFDWRHVLPGDTSAALWRGYRTASEEPMLVNPASGYVMNANNTPYVAAGPGDELDRAGFSPLLGVEDDMTNRAVRAIELFEASGPIGEARLKAIKYDRGYSRASYAGPWLDAIARLDTRGDPKLAKAQALLGKWDWTLANDDPAEALALIVLRPRNRAYYRREPSPDAREELKKASDYLMKHFGRLDPPLGDILRLRQGTVDLPVDGGNDTLRASTLWDEDKDGRFSVRHGDSFIMFVTWDRDGRVHSESIQPFGAATTRPQSPHYADQAPLFVAKKLKPVLFEPAALMAGGRRSYRP